MRSPQSTRCPCLSGKHYKVCCRQVHKDSRRMAQLKPVTWAVLFSTRFEDLTAADTPEKMARARFSALAMKKYDFLIVPRNDWPEWDRRMPSTRRVSDGVTTWAAEFSFCPLARSRTRPTRRTWTFRRWQLMQVFICFSFDNPGG